MRTRGLGVVVALVLSGCAGADRLPAPPAAPEAMPQVTASGHEQAKDIVLPPPIVNVFAQPPTECHPYPSCSVSFTCAVSFGHVTGWSGCVGVQTTDTTAACSIRSLGIHTAICNASGTGGSSSGSASARGVDQPPVVTGGRTVILGGAAAPRLVAHYSDPDQVDPLSCWWSGDCSSTGLDTPFPAEGTGGTVACSVRLSGRTCSWSLTCEDVFGKRGSTTWTLKGLPH